MKCHLVDITLKRSDDHARHFQLGKWRWISCVTGKINTHRHFIWQHKTLTTGGCKSHRDATTHQPNQPHRDMIKARMKKEAEKRRRESVSAGGQWVAQLQEWRLRRKRDLSFLNGDSKNNRVLCLPLTAGNLQGKRG